MDTSTDPVFEYSGRFRPGTIQEEMVEPIAYWWRTADGPGRYFAEHRHVFLDLGPGDMTSYQMYLGVRPGRSMGGLLVALTNWGRVAVIREGNLPPLGEASEYLAVKLGLDEKYEPAKILVSAVASLAVESLAALAGS